MTGVQTCALPIWQEVSREYVVEKLKGLHLSDFMVVSVLKLMENPPAEPNMKKLAPIMNALFPEIKQSIKTAIVNEADVTQWTRGANEMLIKYNVDDQVRRDIIQGAITYYLFTETNNRVALENWIERGGLR